MHRLSVFSFSEASPDRVSILGDGGYLEVAFQLTLYSPFKNTSKRRELLSGLNRIEGLKLPAEVIDKFPRVLLRFSSVKRIKSYFSRL